jgi:hypothetical protein
MDDGDHLALTPTSHSIDVKGIAAWYESALVTSIGTLLAGGNGFFLLEKSFKYCV